MSGLPPNCDAVLEWGIRGSLLSYMERDRAFEIETTGGATFSLADGVHMNGSVDADGVLFLDGSVVLRAHAGALIVPLIGVQVTGDALTIDDPGEDRVELATNPGRLALVRLGEVAGAQEGTLVYATRLAAEADALFMFNYIPDTPFDPLRIRLSVR
ncbi:hypothetical protein QFZ69_002320 [Arthrobacter sp. V1I7]|uniref:HtaA domain-containing protein n=1 Tax=Arthrobacter sp. V1I7 TaxID=3042274 RepID=UPI00278B77B1|nr:HtaA domain-containing protein [Arthrobacter sp. V1I7]MDQ0821441.1 hypothetical protein [Arthrobacter sp. V1I7]